MSIAILGSLHIKVQFAIDDHAQTNYNENIKKNSTNLNKTYKQTPINNRCKKMKFIQILKNKKA